MRTRADYLPWELTAGPKYHARELKQRSKWVTAGSWFMSGLLLAAGVITPYRVAFIFGLFYILALKMQKDTVITKRGLEIFYQMHITTQYDFWSWEQIDSVTLEDRNHPELVALHISKGDRIRRLFFTREDAADIMVLAKKQKPGILVGEADPGRMIGFKRKNKRGQSVRTTMKAYNFSRKK